MIPGLLDYIKANHGKQTAEQMAEHLGTSVKYVRAVCNHNNLKPREFPASFREWSDYEVTVLKAKYNKRPIQEIYDCLPGRSKRSIREKARRMGLSKREPVNT